MARWSCMVPLLAAACATAGGPRVRPAPTGGEESQAQAPQPRSAGGGAAQGQPAPPVKPTRGAGEPALGPVSDSLSAGDITSLDFLRRGRLGAVRGTQPTERESWLSSVAADTSVTAVTQDEVRQEAERLFGSEVPAEATFDIDVTSFSANRRVLEYMEFFQTDARDRFDIWLSRLGRYEGMIRERLRLRGLPEDLVYLTLIESGLSNTAVSRARAVGMWQFMAATARRYGLTVDPWVDERRDPFRATDAAAAMLADLVDRLGSVYLAAAAYNAGAGRVQRGINRLPGDPPDTVTDETFFLLADRRYLRRETRDYVPKLIAAALVAKQPERYGFTEIQLLAPLVFDEATIPDMTGLDVIARLADTTLGAILELNPQFVRGVTPPGRDVVVRVPRGRGERVAARYAELPVKERVTVVVHDVQRGETLSQIARRYRVSVETITAANRGVHPRRLRIGQRLVIPLTGRIVPATAWRAPAEQPSRARRTGRPTAYQVRWGDTLSGIARKYGVSVQALMDENDLTSSVIKGGDILRIPRR